VHCIYVHVRETVRCSQIVEVNDARKQLFIYKSWAPDDITPHSISSPHLSKATAGTKLLSYQAPLTGAGQRMPLDGSLFG